MCGLAGGCVRGGQKRARTSAPCPLQASRAILPSVFSASSVRCLATTAGTVKWFNVTKVWEGGVGWVALWEGLRVCV